MKTGIIVEINERFLTLLTPEGEFMRARRHDRPYDLGEEISFAPFELEQKKPAFLSFLQSLKGKAALTAMIALLLAVGTFLPIYQGTKVYAYMSIDMNPSIELGVNDKLQVIELIPYNQDGRKVIKRIKSWKKEDVQAVTDDILKELEKTGYTYNNKKIIITKVYTGKREKNIDQKLDKDIDTIKHEVNNKKIDVNVMEATKEQREKAKKQGMTAGRFIQNKTIQTKESQESAKPTSEKTIKSKQNTSKAPNVKIKKEIQSKSKQIIQQNPKSNNKKAITEKNNKKKWNVKKEGIEGYQRNQEYRIPNIEHKVNSHYHRVEREAQIFKNKKIKKYDYRKHGLSNYYNNQKHHEH
ncbi:anti-sigma factor domain-containing protein [Cytobacillus sp. Hz8]|uniref:anti-sigma factor domain-containing protein n=1 Tax=Cytobacillus sp. Hz8 TaxID=3347168 RepID=UPI0035D7621E